MRFIVTTLLQRESAGQLKQSKLLNYVDDVLKYKEVLLAEMLGYKEALMGDILGESGEFFCPVREDGKKPRTGYEEIDDDEIDSYIRSEAEVAALKPIFDRVMANAKTN